MTLWAAGSLDEVSSEGHLATNAALVHDGLLNIESILSSQSLQLSGGMERRARTQI